MDDESIKENNIIENKQIRPFIIKEKNNDFNNCSGYYLTSNLNHHYFFRKEINKGLKFILDYNKYSLSNNSLIAFNESYNLPYQNIIRYVESLDDLDKNRLEKYISILNGMQVTLNKENKLVEIGDIVLENNIYYIIYQVDNTNCYGYPIKPYNKYIDLSKNFDHFMFDHKVYFVDYKNYKIFNLNENILITNRFNCDVVDKIKENKKIEENTNLLFFYL